MVKDFTDQLKEQKATIVELEKQLSTRKDQVLRLEGAIEALNKTLKKPEEGIPDAPTTEYSFRDRKVKSTQTTGACKF